MIISPELRAPASPRGRTAERAAALAPILAILLLQAIFSLSLRNTAFQDEALYVYAGRQYFSWLAGGPPVTEPYGLYFSGLPQLYPPLAGALDALGGLELARMLSLAAMLGATLACYSAGAELFGRPAGLLGAALFAVQGPTLFLGRLATYDAMSLALLAAGLALATWSDRPGWLPRAALLGATLLLAAATKYAALLFVPAVLGVAALRGHRGGGPGRGAIVVAVALAAAAALGGAAALLFPAQFEEVLAGLRSTTTNRVALLVSGRAELALRAAWIGGPLLALAAAGAAVALRERAGALLALGLLLTALMPAAYHIYKAEMISLHKHIGFGLLFAAPLAGLATARLAGYGARRPVARRPLAALAVALLLFGAGARQAQGFYAEWANSDAMISVLRTQVRPGTGRILAEESEVPRYYLQDVVSFWQWNHLYWFYYTDAAGNELQGEEAYRAAIAEGHFDLVVLRYGPNAATAHAIDDGLHEGGGYELIARLPYFTMFGEGHYWIWRRAGPPAAAGRASR